MFGFNTSKQPQQNQPQNNGANGNQGQGNNQNQNNQPRQNNGQSNQLNSGSGQNNLEQNGNQNGQMGQNQNQDPLAQFGKLFEDNGNGDADTPPAFSIDPAKMTEVANAQDFTRNVNPETMQKALGGDYQAMVQVMGEVSRGAYRAAIEHGGMLTDKFVGAREAHGKKGVNATVRGHMTDQALSSMPGMNNPVVRKQMTQIATQMQKSFPDATPQEIAEKTKEFMTGVAGAINPQDPKKNANGQEQPEIRGEEFWNDFFDAAEQDGSQTH